MNDHQHTVTAYHPLDLHLYHRCANCLSGMAQEKNGWRRSYSGLSLGVAEWTLAGIFEAVVIDPQVKVLLAKIEYIGFVLAVPFAFLFVTRYLSTQKLNLAGSVSVFIIPVITLAMAWTNDAHHLLWSSLSRVTRH